MLEPTNEQVARVMGVFREITQADEEFYDIYGRYPQGTLPPDYLNDPALIPEMMEWARSDEPGRRYINIGVRPDGTWEATNGNGSIHHVADTPNAALAALAMEVGE